MLPIIYEVKKKSRSLRSSDSNSYVVLSIVVSWSQLHDYIEYHRGTGLSAVAEEVSPRVVQEL